MQLLRTGTGMLRGRHVLTTPVMSPGPLTPRTLIGREHELEALDRLIGALAPGPAILRLDGGAGIGKSALFDAALARARRRGIRVVVARPTESESRLSFVALTDLLSTAHDAFAILPDPTAVIAASVPIVGDGGGWYAVVKRLTGDVANGFDVNVWAICASVTP